MVLGIAILLSVITLIFALNTNAEKKRLRKEQQILSDEKNKFLVYCEEKKRQLDVRDSLLSNTAKELKEQQDKFDVDAFRFYSDYKYKSQQLNTREAALPGKFKEFVFSQSLKILSHDYFRDTHISKHLSSFSYTELLKDSHFISATTEKRIMKYPINVSAEIKGETDTYTVTLNSCTCPDYVYRHIPCKHMYQLALEMGVLFYFKDRFWQEMQKRESEFYVQSSETLNMLNSIAEKNAVNRNWLLEREKIVSEKEQNLYLKVSQKVLDKFFEEKKISYPWFASVFADYVYTLDTKSETCINSHYGSKASQERERLRLANKNLNIKNKLLEHQLAVYESVAPWLLDFKELSTDEVASNVFVSSTSDLDDSERSAIKVWLSDIEYNQLSDIDKYQLALDRWKKRHKSNWEAGIEYERYIGYLYELENYKVKFQGAVRGFDDMGVDLVVYKKNTVYLIQCKRYSDKKTVHENTVFQLYGSCIYSKIKQPSKDFKPIIYTTAQLSDIAQKCADYLGVEVHSCHQFKEYPLIKCNISSDGKKIFHLPFDQQYDHIIISPKKGEFYANTVAEAVNNGFRRAFRWSSDSSCLEQ